MNDSVSNSYFVLDHDQCLVFICLNIICLFIMVYLVGSMNNTYIVEEIAKSKF